MLIFVLTQHKRGRHSFAAPQHPKNATIITTKPPINNAYPILRTAIGFVA